MITFTRSSRGGGVLAWLAPLALALAACQAPPAPEAALLLVERPGVGAELDEFRTRAHALGTDVLALSARDLATQAAQVERALEGGAKVLVVEPVDAAASVAFVERAHERGARIVAYDRAIPADALDVYVAHDNYRVGVLQAEAALAATGGRGRYVLLAGPADDAVAHEITRGYVHTLAPYVARGDVEVVLRPPSLERELARGPIAAVLANHSALARAAVTTLEAAGTRGVFIAGADAELASLELVCQGRQTIEVVKARASLARTAAELAHRLARGDDLAREVTSIEIGGRHVRVASVRVELVRASGLPACAPAVRSEP